MVERFGHLLAEHPLRRELIATVNANLVANSLGPTFVSQLAAERGADAADVVRAYRVAREVTGADARWDAIEQLPRGIDRAVADELMARRRPARRRRHALVPRPRRPRARSRSGSRPAEAPFARLVAVLPEIGGDEWRTQRRETADALVAKGVPEDVAWAHALPPELMQAPDIIAVAAATRAARWRTSRARTTCSAQRLDIVWLLGALDELTQPTRTQRWAVQAVREDCLDAVAELARCALAGTPGDADAEDGRRRLSRGARRAGAAPARGDRARSPSRAPATCPR